LGVSSILLPKIAISAAMLGKKNRSREWQFCHLYPQDQCPEPIQRIQ